MNSNKNCYHFFTKLFSLLLLINALAYDPILLGANAREYQTQAQAKSLFSSRKSCFLASMTGLLIGTGAGTGAGIGIYYLFNNVLDNSDPNPTSPTNPPPSKFNIQLLNMGTNTDYDASFLKAKARWESIITNNLPSVDDSVHDWFDGEFSTPVDGPIDDILIGYSIEPIDGNGNTLGFAGPVYIRPGYGSVASGIMKFDEVDFADMPEEDRELIILHEMAHVLGIGTLWRYKCGTSCSSGDHSYSCPKANEKYNELNFANMELTLENDGSKGTSCGHWDEASFAHSSYSELMTGYFEAHKAQPLSAVTAAALEDLGDYKVDYSATDAFPESSIRGAALIKIPKPSRTFSLHDRVVRPKIIELDQQSPAER